MKTIALTQGKVALVDDGDYDFISQWKWRVLKANRKETELVYYAYRTTARPNRKSVYMHRAIAARAGLPDVDHKDADGLNNQRDNLRPCTKSQNRWNMRKRSGCTSQFKGVYWHKKTRLWMARICCFGKYHFLGTFQDEIIAAKAYDSAAISHFGEFALLNFPNELIT